MKPTKILLADDHPLILQGIKELLEQKMENLEIFTAANGLEALNTATSILPDLVILDMEMPYLSGLEVAQKLKIHHPEIKIIILSLHKEQSLFNALQNVGVEAYILKEFSLDEIEQGVREVLKGKKFYSRKLLDSLQNDSLNLEILTTQEINVLKLIARQKTTKEIADMLFVSPKTIEKHRYNICKKLGLKAEKNSLLKWVLKHHKQFL